MLQNHGEKVINGKAFQLLMEAVPKKDQDKTLFELNPELKVKLSELTQLARKLGLHKLEFT